MASFRPRTPRYPALPKARVRPLSPTMPPISPAPYPVVLMPSNDDNSRRRMDDIEDRLIHQEKTTQNLIDKAYKIKEDIIETMNISHGSWQSEKQSRTLLTDHIRNITVIVKRLSREIEVLEDQLKARDGLQQTQDGAVKNLEMRQVMTVADLQSRIGRCDAALARISADLRTAFESIRNVNGQQQNTADSISSRINQLEVKVNNLLMSFDSTSTDHVSKIRAVEGDTNSGLARLDSKYAGLVEDLRSSILATRNWSETERGKMENQFLAYMESHKQYYENRLVKIERYMEERLSGLEKRIDQLEGWRETILHSTEREEDRQKFASWERAVGERIAALERKLLSLLAKHRSDVDDGFGSLQSSFETMQSVFEGKRRLTEDILREEIEDIRKLFVLV